MQCARDAILRACGLNLWPLYSAIQPGWHQGAAQQFFPKIAGMRKPLRFSFDFLTGIAFFWPGYGGAHPGGGAAEKHHARNARRDFGADGVQQHQTES